MFHRQNGDGSVLCQNGPKVGGVKRPHPCRLGKPEARSAPLLYLRPQIGEEGPADQPCRVGDRVAHGDAFHIPLKICIKL